MTFKNTKTNKQILTTIIFTILLVVGIGSPVVGYAQATTVNDQIIPEDVAMATIKKYEPSKLTAVELAQVKQIALSDARVQQAINGKPFEFMAQGFLGNIKTTPVIWYPTIQINANNKTEIAIEVDIKSNSVKDVQITHLRSSHSPVKGTSGIGVATFADDYYTGSHTIAGLYSTLTAPTISGPAPKVLWLVNGLESVGSDGNACSSGSYYNNYFAQAGFDFADSMVAFTDTTFNCQMQNAMVSYSAGDPYLFEVYTTSGSFNWKVVTLDQRTGLSHLYTGPAVAANNLRTNDLDTSVWFENQMTSTGWASLFSSIVASNAQYKEYSTSAWNSWDAEGQIVLNCQGVNIGNNNVMTGGLVNNGQTTWNLSNFQQTHC